MSKRICSTFIILTLSLSSSNIPAVVRSFAVKGALPISSSRFYASGTMMRLFAGRRTEVVGAGRAQVVGPWWAEKVVLNEAKGGTSTTKSSQRAGAKAKSREEISDTSDDGRAVCMIAEKLMSTTKSLFAVHLQEDGKTVDYEALEKSEGFKDYVLLCEELINVDLHTLDVNARKAFFINTYNSLIWHGIIAFGKPPTFNDRLKLYATAAYNIGGMVFSLNDIENGILRGNKKGAAPLSVLPFPKGDPRAELVVPLDPRIHFALNCGAMSCPPIRFYTAEKVDTQLDIATKGFVNALELDADGNLKLSQIFKWYFADFAASDVALLNWIAPFLNETKRAALQKKLDEGTARVIHEEYDWSINQS